MKLFAGLCASLLLVVSSVGCCCMSSCVSSCDPCGRELAGGGWGSSSSCGCGCGVGGCLSKWFSHKFHKCHPTYAGYGWDAYARCGGVCYDGCNTTFDGPAAGGCACGQPHAAPMQMVPSVPPAQPAPAPMNVDPMTSRQAPPRSMPHAAHHPAQQTQRVAPQHVSYEEFQRLPGVMTSGPQTQAPPVLAAPAAQPTTQPASWSAAK